MKLSNAQIAIIQTVVQSINNDGCELQILVDLMQDVKPSDEAGRTGQEQTKLVLRDEIRRLETSELNLRTLLGLYGVPSETKAH